jgi:hypothetical protein
MDFTFPSGSLEKQVARPQAETLIAEIVQINSGINVSTSQTSHSSDENPQSPETLDSSTPTVDFASLNLND